MKKEGVDYIMDIMFDDLMNFIQSEQQTQIIPPDDKKLCSLVHRKPEISPQAIAEGLYCRANNRHYFKYLKHTDAVVSVSSWICKICYYNNNK